MAKALAFKECQWGGASTSLPRLSLKIAEFSKRLDGVVVENLDWAECLALYDGPDTFFFVDPPYLQTGQRAYASFNLTDFRRLRSGLAGAKGSWMLTTNDHPALRSLFKSFNIRSVSRARGIKSGQDYKELIITPK